MRYKGVRLKCNYINRGVIYSALLSQAEAQAEG